MRKFIHPKIIYTQYVSLNSLLLIEYTVHTYGESNSSLYSCQLFNLWSLVQLEITYHSKERGKLGRQFVVVHDVDLPLGEFVVDESEFINPRG